VAGHALEHPLLPGGDHLLLCLIWRAVRAAREFLCRLQAYDDLHFALVADLRGQLYLPPGLVERVFRRAWLSVVRGVREFGNRAADQGEYSEGGRAEAAQEVLHHHYRLCERTHAVFDLDCLVQQPSKANYATFIESVDDLSGKKSQPLCGKNWIPVQIVDSFPVPRLKSESATDPRRYAEPFQSIKATQYFE
jgi:hypothetical protein